MLVADTGFAGLAIGIAGFASDIVLPDPDAARRESMRS